MTLRIDPTGTAVIPKDIGITVVEFPVDLPEKIYFNFSGKNQTLDTILDDKGHISRDLCVILKNLWLDGIVIPSQLLNKIIRFQTESDQTLYVNYFGFNGTATLDLSQENIFDQIMDWYRLN